MRGGGGKYVREAAQDPEAFARCARRLERAIADACETGASWPGRVSAAIRAFLDFADADPVATRVVVIHSAQRRYGGAEFEAVVERMATALSKGAPPTRHPERTARNVVLTIARQVLLQLEGSRPEQPSSLAPGLIAFALTPYLGFAEAQSWADPGAS